MNSHLTAQRSLPFFCLVLVLLLLCPTLAARAADTATNTPESMPAASTPLLNPQDPLNRPVTPEPAVVDVWASLLQDHIHAIDAINTEVNAFSKQLPELGRRVTEQVASFEEEFKKLSSIAQVSRGLDRKSVV